MNIVYFSHLSNSIYAGPNFSVPAGINAQSEFDNCLWVNLTNADQPHWHSVSCFHNVSEFGRQFSLESLPAPFNNPDLVVFEGFYWFPEVRISWLLRKKGIPYIIVPRGSLTRQAMNNHSSLKKRMAHFLFFDGYCRHALAIQYLTEKECADSYRDWNQRSFILPNGFSLPNRKKEFFSKKGIKMVFIGRPDKYHKGLDLLWEAMRQIRDELYLNDVTLNFYAPKDKADYNELFDLVDSYGLHGIVSMHDKIGGQEKEEALLSSDVFVLTSRFEGHPMGLIEALAYGLPCLVSTGTNMRSEIEVSGAGWTCDASVDSIVNALRKMLSTRESFINKSQNARELAIKYDWRVIAKKFDEEIKKLI